MNDYTTPQDNSPEIWRDIPGYEGCYQASTQGSVRRLTSQHPESSKIIASTKGKSGYQQVGLSKGERKTYSLHTLIALTFLGERPIGFVVNHKNGVKEDNRLDNLEYVTHSENNRHAVDVLGIYQDSTGARSGSAKLSKIQVELIRSEYANKTATQRQLAKRYSVSLTAINLIIRRITWQHVK